MNLKDGLHHALQQRAYGSVTSDVLFRRARGSKYFIQCLERSGTLTGHDGCVNSISWNDSGDLLLSGSDDCRLNIYMPFQKKLLQSIRTGHRANIFSAKFLPCCGDKKIVSCSGDGVLHYTDIERPETFGSHSYNCHSGTAYEVITTPGDPNTFISCGEDGTVRMFDVRTKSKCVKRECKDDILIECGKAVTSISINPLAPYQLGIGCEDSTVALFDRRSLSPGGASSGFNGMKGMTYKFKPEALKDRTCRVTSLEYSGDGRELLVSYCADYVYLFDAKGQKEVRCTNDTEAQGNGLIQGNSKKNVPMKRLRLRGDWSDTGPNARPESEAGASTESTLMQRMSDLFVRWIEESFRGSQRSRLRPAQSRASSSSSVSSTASFPSRSTNSSSSDSSGILEASGVSRDGEAGIDEEEMDESTSPSPSVITVKERSMDDLQEGKGDSPKECLDKEDAEMTLLDISMPGSSGLCNDIETKGESPDEFSRESPLCVDKEDVEMTSTPGSSGRFNDIEAKKVNESVSFDTNHDDKQLRPEQLCGNRNLPIPSITLSPNEHETRLSNVNDLKETCTIEQGVANTRVELQGSTSNDQEMHNEQTIIENSQQSVASTGDEPQRETTSDQDINMAVENSVASPRGDPVRQTTGSHARNNEQVTVENSQQGVASTRGEVSASAETSASSQDNVSDGSHSLAATRIQRMFRNYKASKSAKTMDDWDYAVDGKDDVMWVPKMTRVYRGHRNARTMIKEARFLGEQYVVSGSDCGRIFIWDKHTTEIVMVLQGDRHVVNCVQPHPFYPVLASSGIDYDIKLWMPTASHPVQVEGLDEIVRTNEQMLEESRDTITVPASFMLRMLASLNHARLGRNQDDSDTDSNESE